MTKVADGKKPLPSQDEFITNSVHECDAPADTECMVCLEPFSNGEKVSKVDHKQGESFCYFHTDCITGWFNSTNQRRGECPLDRIPLFVPTELTVALTNPNASFDPQAVYDRAGVHSTKIDAFLHRVRRATPVETATLFVINRNLRDEADADVQILTTLPLPAGTTLASNRYVGRGTNLNMLVRRWDRFFLLRVRDALLDEMHLVTEDLRQMTGLSGFAGPQDLQVQYRRIKANLETLRVIAWSERTFDDVEASETAYQSVLQTRRMADRLRKEYDASNGVWEPVSVAGSSEDVE